MNLGNPIVLVAISAVVVVGIAWVARKFFSDDARWERRRRRINAPISSRAKRPSVKFSVRTKKERRK